jgi:hypothetical protein
MYRVTLDRSRTSQYDTVMAVLILPALAPALADFKAGVPHESPDRFIRKLVTVLSVNCFTLLKMKIQLCYRDDTSSSRVLSRCISMRDLTRFHRARCRKLAGSKSA